MYGSLTYQLREATEEAASLPDLLWQVIKILASGGKFYRASGHSAAFLTRLCILAWVSVVLGVLLIVTLMMSYFGKGGQPFRFRGTKSKGGSALTRES